MLAACGLGVRAAGLGLWAGTRQWHVLQTRWDEGVGFLETWRTWQEDPKRPQRLFFTGIAEHPPDTVCPDTLKADPALAVLASELFKACQGLMPGTHRLVFEQGQVQLTLCVGPLDKGLRELDVAADTVFWSPSAAPDPATENPDSAAPPDPDTPSPLQSLQAIARLCRPGSRLCALPPIDTALAPSCGFEPCPSSGGQTPRAVWVYAPHWTPRSRLRQTPWPHARQAVVVGAGLSGSAVAHSLARRGWQVTVIDHGTGVGAGASGLPAGLAAPHVSPDDSVLSRITRAGVRSTLQRAAACLQEGSDWALSGVLEHRVEGKRSLPEGPAWPAAAHQWSTPASRACLAMAGLPPETAGLWHDLAGWIRPRQLVAAQLQAPGIQTLWQQTVARIERVHAGTPEAPALWQVLNAEGDTLATAPLVILASAFNSHALLQGLCGPEEKPPIPLNPLRGQISFGLMRDLPEALRPQLPPFPVNGHGSFISGVPTVQGDSGWFIGSTFERQCTDAPLRDEDHAANRQRLATLLPGLGTAMQSQFDPGRVHGWAGLRCTLPDRLPAVGPVNTARWPGLWIAAGMGARGISLAVMCGEVCAALLENEPLPLAPSLARHLMAARFAPAAPQTAD